MDNTLDSKNHKKRWLIVLAVLVALSTVYIFAIRPARVKAYCHRTALHEAAYTVKVIDGAMVTVPKDPEANGYSQKDYEQVYSMCTRSNGV